MSKIEVKYIWVDQNGNKIKEKVRGKGRPPRGVEALPRPDGNYYIVVNVQQAEQHVAAE